MQTDKPHSNIKTIRAFFVFLLTVGFVNISLAITMEQASEQVKSLPCKDNMTTDQVLERSIKSHSQRDIGWRTFQEEAYFDVERIVLVNKGLELRYRWRVESDGSITAKNDRTEKLCHDG